MLSVLDGSSVELGKPFDSGAGDAWLVGLVGLPVDGQRHRCGIV
jgi:hypothetical protein